MTKLLPRLLLVLSIAGLLAACTSARVVRNYYPDDEARPAASAPARVPPPKPVVLPIPASETYVVKPGDTLYGIATRYGLSYRQVAEWNGLAEPFAIQVGQPLVLAEPPEIVTEPAVATAPVGAPVKPVAATSPPVTKPPTSAPTPFETVPTAPATSTTTPPVAVATAPSPAKPTTPPAGSPPVATGPNPTTGPAVAPVTGPTVPIPVPAPTPAVPVAAPVPPVVAPVVEKPVVEKPMPPIAGAPSWRWPTRGEIIGRYVNGDQTQQGINIAGKAGQSVNAAADGVVVYSGAGLVGYGELIIVKHSDEWLSAYAHNRRRLVAEGTKVKAGDAIAEMGRTGAVRDMLHFEIRRNGKPVDPLLFLPKQ